MFVVIHYDVLRITNIVLPILCMINYKSYYTIGTFTPCQNILDPLLFKTTRKIIFYRDNHNDDRAESQ